MSQSHFYFELKSQDQFNLLTKNSKVCVVDFYTKWCGPCKALAPALEQKVRNDSKLFPHVCLDSGSVDVKDVENKVVFVKVNVEVHEDLSSIFKINSIPYIVFFSNGELQHDVVMGNDSDKIINIVKKLGQIPS